MRQVMFRLDRHDAELQQQRTNSNRQDAVLGQLAIRTASLEGRTDNLESRADDLQEQVRNQIANIQNRVAEGAAGPSARPPITPRQRKPRGGNKPYNCSELAIHNIRRHIPNHQILDDANRPIPNSRLLFRCRTKGSSAHARACRELVQFRQEDGRVPNDKYAGFCQAFDDKVMFDDVAPYGKKGHWEIHIQPRRRMR
ncbi:hypothetical protein HDV00_012107 [Rhizophlyctis rosea]|nr:hypothetical protein HDV00_012107 [Rhizophlyctis rosea]